jgi:uncharacterized membrane protein YhdT
LNPGPVEAAPSRAAGVEVAIPQAARQKIKDGVWALSLANLYLVNAWYIVLYTSPEMQYLKKVPPDGAKLLGLVGNLLWLSVVIWVVIRAVRRARWKWLRPVCEWLFLVSLLLPLDFCRQTVLAMPASQALRYLRHPLGLLGCLLLLVCLLFRRRWVVRAVVVLVAILSPLVLMTSARLVYWGVEQDAVAREYRPPPLAPLSPAHPGQPRVVWILFDETDQRLGFEERPAWLQMPEFDRLRSQCLSATNAYPLG